MRYEKLREILPKYARDYMGSKKGETKPCVVIGIVGALDSPDPNDPAIFNRKVKSLDALSKKYGREGLVRVELW